MRENIALSNVEALLTTLWGQTIEQHQKGEFAAAEAGYRQIIALMPSHYMAQSNLGVLLGMHSRLDEAIACFRAALKFNPDSAIYHNLGDALFEKNRLDEANVAFREALRLNPNLGHAAAKLIQLMRELCQWNDDLDTLIANLKKAITTKAPLAHGVNPS